MMKEPEIKLFGRKILLSENAAGEYSGESSDESSNRSGGDVDCEGGKGCDTEEQQIDEDQFAGVEDENPDANATSESDDNPITASIDEDVASENDRKAENDQSEETNGNQKTLKKPDKILPCPRCNSMDTKFCYYNNYNVNQPRHFCKSCQRYWTAGGTMRNVPVGAGRRKNKNSTSHCRHITISEALEAARIDAPNDYHQMKFKSNGTVLSFGSDTSSLCESKDSGLNVEDKRASKVDDAKNGLQQQNINGYPYQVPCIQGVPWPFPWNSAVPIPAAICPPGYPMPYYPAPAPYWSCGVPNAWNVPWLSIPQQNVTGSSPSSPLGKHSRNGELLSPNKSSEAKEEKSRESSIVVPKTLRMDDPEEAAKSSIWETLGIKYDSLSRGGLFKALQPKEDEKKSVVSTSPLLQANPAALSRSINFRERA